MSSSTTLRVPIKTCPCGSIISRGHFLRCPLASFNNPMAGRLDPKAFWHSHQLFENRRVRFKLHGSARDEQKRLTIPTLRRPVSSPRLIQRPQNRHPPATHNHIQKYLTWIFKSLGFSPLSLIPVLIYDIHSQQHTGFSPFGVFRVYIV
jgi:hypothetical protein